MEEHECAPCVYLLSDSTRESARLIEEWVYKEGHFEPPIHISASIITDNHSITALNVKWVWDYDLAATMKRRIGIGFAIALNIKLYSLSKNIGFKWNPVTTMEVYNTFNCLLSLIPSLRKHITVKR